MFDFWRITLFCLEKRLSNHKMTIYSKNLGGHGPFSSPGYAYGGWTGWRTQSCAGRVNPHCFVCGSGLNLLRDGRELNLLPVRGGRGMRNSSCGQMSVEPMHMNLISSKIAKHMDVLKLFASIALRTVGPQQL